jgi:hypothetical protein
MGAMDGWDVALLVAAGYVAAVSLVRLMLRRRNQLLDQFRAEIEKERKRKGDEERRTRRSENLTRSDAA